MERMDCDDHGASSGEEELNKLRNKENENSSDDYSESSCSEEEEAKEIDEIKQVLSNDELDDSESASDTSDSESDEEDEQDDKSLPARTYIPKKGKKNDDLVVDESAYVLLCKSKTSYPCMSFDIINDNLGENRSNTFPISMSMVGGTYSGRANADSLIVMKYSKLFPNSKNFKDQQIITEQDTKQQGATLRYVKISHAGSVNRIRCTHISKCVIYLALF